MIKASIIARAHTALIPGICMIKSQSKRKGVHCSGRRYFNGQQGGRQAVNAAWLTMLKGPTQQCNAHDATHALPHVLHCMYLCQKVHSPVLHAGQPIVLSTILQVHRALYGA